MLVSQSWHALAFKVELTIPHFILGWGIGKSNGNTDCPGTKVDEGPCHRGKSVIFPTYRDILVLLKTWLVQHSNAWHRYTFCVSGITMWFISSGDTWRWRDIWLLWRGPPTMLIEVKILKPTNYDTDALLSLTKSSKGTKCRLDSN